MRRSLAAVVLTGLGCSALILTSCLLLAFGSTSPASAAPLTLQEAYRSALGKNERLAIAGTEVEQALRRRDQALALALPTLTLESDLDRSAKEVFVDRPVTRTETSVRLEQTLYAGGRTHSGLRIARLGIVLTERDRDLAEEALLFNVADAYYAVLKTGARLEAEQRNLARLAEHRRQAEIRFRVGEVTRAVLLRADAELAGGAAELLAAKQALAEARDRLGVLAKVPPDFEPVEPPLPREPPPESEADQGLRRPDILRADTAVATAREQIRFARGAFFPKLSVSGQYFRRTQDPESVFFLDESWSVGAKLEFPLFEGGTRRAEYRAARARLREEELNRVLALDNAGLQSREARRNAETLVGRVEQLEKQVAFARENFEVTSRQFAAGLVTNVDLLDADLALIQAERELISARYDRHLALLTLQRSVGVFRERALEAR